MELEAIAIFLQAVALGFDYRLEQGALNEAMAMYRGSLLLCVPHEHHFGLAKKLAMARHHLLNSQVFQQSLLLVQFLQVCFHAQHGCLLELFRSSTLRLAPMAQNALLEEHHLTIYDLNESLLLYFLLSTLVDPMQYPELELFLQEQDLTTTPPMVHLLLLSKALLMELQIRQFLQQQLLLQHEIRLLTLVALHSSRSQLFLRA